MLFPIGWSKSYSLQTTKTNSTNNKANYPNDFVNTFFNDNIINKNLSINVINKNSSLSYNLKEKKLFDFTNNNSLPKNSNDTFFENSFNDSKFFNEKQNFLNKSNSNSNLGDVSSVWSTCVIYAQCNYTNWV